jgi:antitoxin component YwqK of YwqJK toxin-antitoxin module
MMSRKLFIYSIVLFVSFSTYAQDTIIKYYNEDRIRIYEPLDASFYRKMYENEDKVWIVNDYYISGEPKMTSAYYSFKIARLHGPTIYYHKNGRLSSAGEYVKGEWDGKWKFWYENSQLQEKGSYSKTERVGVWEGWHENGNKFFYKEYDSKGRLGNHMYYYESGEIKGEYIFVSKEHYMYKAFYENGTLKAEGEFLKDQKTGHWKYYNSDSRLTLEGGLKYGKKNGPWKRYFPSGEVIILYFDFGKISGKKYGGLIRTTD